MMDYITIVTGFGLAFYLAYLSGRAYRLAKRDKYPSDYLAVVIGLVAAMGLIYAVVAP
jgi:hypothetical protein